MKITTKIENPMKKRAREATKFWEKEKSGYYNSAKLKRDHFQTPPPPPVPKGNNILKKKKSPISIPVPEEQRINILLVQILNNMVNFRSTFADIRSED